MKIQAELFLIKYILRPFWYDNPKLGLSNWSCNSVLTKSLKQSEVRATLSTMLQLKDIGPSEVRATSGAT